ncbi:MAG: hypothetical protein GY832_00070 [Chloroflexi bacterium]|nr:hypothetical protein [Chloroflexota bacterium]
MKKEKNRSLIFTIAIAVVVVATVGISSCRRPDATKIPSPLPGDSPLQPDSPIVTPPSDAPTPPPVSEVVPFQLDKPLQEGDTRVTGTGPADAPIRLEDVTFAGRFIAAGQIEKDNTFELVLSEPLEAQHRVGLTVDVAGTSWTIEDFQSPEFNGDGALQIPQIGFYFDTAMVQEP